VTVNTDTWRELLPSSYGGDTGSNPVGDANKIKCLKSNPIGYRKTYGKNMAMMMLDGYGQRWTKK